MEVFCCMPPGLTEAAVAHMRALRAVVLDPLTYCGQNYVYDPVCNLVFLPIR